MLVSIALLALKSVLDVPEHELTIDLSNGITTIFNFKYDLGIITYMCMILPMGMLLLMRMIV